MQCVADASIENPRAEASDLAARFAHGDADALAEVIALYGPRISALAYRLMGYHGDLDDMVQDIFLAALQSRNRFRSESSLWTWLTSITLNRCRAHCRKQRSRRLAMRLIWPHSESIAPAADGPAIENEKATKVRAAVAALTWRDREIIVLHYFEQMSIVDVGLILKKEPGAVAVQLHRARQRLRDILPDGLMEN
jgi:RNA polymerase sigma-70 factor (ECF subfamily)